MGSAMATAIVLAGVSQLLWKPPSPQAPPTAAASTERSPRQAAVAAVPLEPGELPRVVCGMTIIPADPSADPRMVKAPPADTRFVIRAIKPPLCVD